LAGLQEHLAQITATGATIVGISVDEAPESKMLIGTLGLRFPLLQDPEAEVAARYGVRMRGMGIAIPSVFVVAPSGEIVWRHVGETVPDRPTPEKVLAAIAAR
jgi:peroxiredoxin